jgi:trk system potassium uptake protein TrkH
VPVTRFIETLDLRVVAVNLAAMLRLFAGVLVAPLIVSLAAREWTSSLYFGALAAAAYAIGRPFKVDRSLRMGVKEGLVVTALSYLLFSLLGAVPFLQQEAFVDGFFESMSGFTTTGLTVVHLETLPTSLLFFRAYSQWIGGAGIIVLSLIVLLGPGQSSFQLYTSEFGEENLAGDVKATARWVLRVYLILTAAGFAALFAAGMAPFDALLHVMATVSTGGFSPYADSIGHYPGGLVRGVVVVFMALGAVGFPSYYLVRHRGWKRLLEDLQLQYLAGLIIACSVLFFVVWGGTLNKLIPSLFQATTAVTTTGFAVADTQTLPHSVWLVSVFLMMIGGSAGSTAGGIKLFRLIVMVKLFRWALIRHLFPEEAKLPVKYGGRVIADPDLKQVFGFVGMFLVLVCLSTLLLIVAGAGITGAFYESASAIGTVGLSAGVASAGLVDWAKLVLCFDMWAGRLEILPVLLVFYLRLWVPKGGKKR